MLQSRTAAIALAAFALAAALVGCGGQNREGGGSETQATSGDAIFREAGCAGCHTLSAAGSQGTTGPNLDERRPSAAQVEQKVRRGGGGMPSFEGRLSDAQIRAVADYVSRSAGGGGQ